MAACAFAPAAFCDGETAAKPVASLDASAPAAMVGGKCVLTVGEARGMADMVIDKFKKAGELPADSADEERVRADVAFNIANSFAESEALAEAARKSGTVLAPEDLAAAEKEMREQVAMMAARGAIDPKEAGAVTNLAAFADKAFPFDHAHNMRLVENGILVRKFLKSEIEAKVSVSDDTLKSQIALVVSNNTEAAKQSEAALARIKELKAKIDAGADFAELAKEHSACPSKAKGGDLGEFSRGMMVPEFDKVAFELPAGKVSDPVKTQFGWHLVKVTEKKPDGKTVRASHILLACRGPVPVPTLEEAREAALAVAREEETEKLVGRLIGESGMETLIAPSAGKPEDKR